MWDMIKQMVSSKKFSVMIFSVLALVCTALAGQMGWTEAIEKMWPLVVAYLGAQGLADFGKEKHKTESGAADTGESKSDG
jgi:hypothetical protein